MRKLLLAIGAFFLIAGPMFAQSGVPNGAYSAGISSGGSGTASLPSGTDTGAANAYVVNPTPAVTLTQTNASCFTFTTTNANTGASTMNASGLGVKNLTTDSAGALAANSILANTVYGACYDGTEWVLSGNGSTPASTANIGNGQITLFNRSATGGTGVGSPMIFRTYQTNGSNQTLMQFDQTSTGNRWYMDADADGAFGFRGNLMFFQQVVDFFSQNTFEQNTSVGGNDITINPGPGGAKTSGNAVIIQNFNGPTEFQVDSVNGNVSYGGGAASGAIAFQGESQCETAGAVTTVSTGSATTTTGLNCVPANSVIDAVVYRITTTITTAANFTVGIGGSTSKFCASQATLTAGTTGICTAQINAGASFNAAATAVVLTFNATPGAGAIRLITYYHTWTPPTS